MTPSRERWLVRLNAFIEIGPTGHGHTDGYNMTTEAKTAAEAVSIVLEECRKDLPQDAALASVLPWAWRIGEDGRPLDQGGRVEVDL
jgi:hypothetical protein